jgi:hypothetical protein
MSSLDATLENLSELTKDFWIESKITVLTNPSAIKFLRSSFSTYTPSLLRGTLHDTKASGNWNMEYLKELLQHKLVKINFTSHGLADSVIQVPAGQADSQGDSDNYDNSTCNINNNQYLNGNHHHHQRHQHPCHNINTTSAHNITATTKTTSTTTITSTTTTTTRDVFVYPLEQAIPFSLFYDMLKNPTEADAVPYLSEQNDNLRQEFPELLQDFIPAYYPLAKECFQDNDCCGSNSNSSSSSSSSSNDNNSYRNNDDTGSGSGGPEAVNLWIGDERSSSSLHKDHYEVRQPLMRIH